MVVVDGKVDESETKKLRDSMRAERDDVEMFDFGGDLKTIKEKCFEETKLHAPDSPSFVTN